MLVEETMPTKRQVDNRTEDEKSASREESARFKAQMCAVLKGTKVQLSVIDDAFFGPNGRYRIIVRGLSKDEAREIIEAVAALSLVAK
jgi:hypothetical protein